VIIGVLQIVTGILTLGNGGGAVGAFGQLSKGSFKQIWESTKNAAKKALDVLKDPETYKNFLKDVAIKSVGKSVCKQLAASLLKKTAEGPLEAPPEPSWAQKVLNSNLS
jgi:hypothetical protein